MGSFDYSGFDDWRSYESGMYAETGRGFGMMEGGYMGGFLPGGDFGGGFGSGIFPDQQSYGTALIQNPAANSTAQGTSLSLGPLTITGLDAALKSLTSGSSYSSSANLQDRIVAQLNDLEVLLGRNVASYQAGTVSQSEALSFFDRGWAWVTSAQGLANPQLGSWGQNGIQDRNRGGKYDWFARYRDPISKTAISGAIGQGLDQIGQTVGTSGNMVLVVIAGIVVLVYLAKHKKGL